MRDPRKKKKRHCRDRLRAKMFAAKRASKADPAMSASMQLLTVFAVFFGRMPLVVPKPVLAPYTPPPPSPLSVHRDEMARRLGIPQRYLDVFLSQGQVPYSILFNHIRQGGVLRRDAMIEFRKRVPEATLEWLNDIQNCGHWSDLVRCHVPTGNDEDTDVEVLKSTLAWLGGPTPGKNSGGPAGSLEKHTPASVSDAPENDGDPTKPKEPTS